MNGAALAFAALVALAAGSPPPEERTLTLALCSGGDITIPLGDGDTPQRGCDPTACHATACREKAKEKLPGAKGLARI